MSSPLDSVVLADADAITPHETPLDAHVRELVDAIFRDGYVQHPVISLALGLQHYVLLDGTHRLAALTSIGVRRVPLQVFERNDVRVDAWAKVVVHRRGCAAVLDAPLAWRRGDNATATVRVRAGDGQCWHSGKASATLEERYDILMTVLSSVGDADEIRSSVPSHAKPNGQGSFVLGFRAWSLEDVIELARQRKRLPSGLTRVIVAGRILNLRVPLEMLQGRLDTAAWREFIADAKRRARVYDEPTVLVD